MTVLLSAILQIIVGYLLPGWWLLQCDDEWVVHSGFRVCCTEYHSKMLCIGYFVCCVQAFFVVVGVVLVISVISQPVRVWWRLTKQYWSSVFPSWGLVCFLPGGVVFPRSKQWDQRQARFYGEKQEDFSMCLTCSSKLGACKRLASSWHVLWAKLSVVFPCYGQTGGQRSAGQIYGEGQTECFICMM